MKEKIVVKGYGTLHDKKFGNIKINSDIVYDKNEDQYRIGNQWIIPFHRHEQKK